MVGIIIGAIVGATVGMFAMAFASASKVEPPPIGRNIKMTINHAKNNDKEK